MRTLGLFLVLILVPAVLVGCGGAGPDPPPLPQGGAIAGSLANTPNPTTFRLLLDGQQLDTTPDAQGAFRVPNVPPGQHTLAVVGGSGMVGVWVTVEVPPDQTADVGELEPVPGGQIAGFVIKQAEDGTLTPLAGVEVLADPNVVYIMTGAPLPAIYPPLPRDPSLVPYKAITNENGSYLMPAVAEGSYTVSVNVPGFEPGLQWVYVGAGQTAAADFHLREAVEPGVGTVHGTVSGALPEGVAPLEGATVAITLPGPWMPSYPTEPMPLTSLVSSGNLTQIAPAGLPGAPADVSVIMPPYQWDVFRTLTNALGQYTLNVPSGHLTAEAWAEGYEWTSAELTLQPREDLLQDFLLQPWEAPPPEPGEPGTTPTG